LFSSALTKGATAYILQEHLANGAQDIVRAHPDKQYDLIDPIFPGGKPFKIHVRLQFAMKLFHGTVIMSMTVSAFSRTVLHKVLTSISAIINIWPQWSVL
jgi:hypothetical protein